MITGRERKFRRKIKKLSKEEERARDERFREAVARLEADPEYIALQAACRRADERGPNVKCTV